MMFFSRNNKKTEKVQQEKSRNILSLSPMGSAKYSFSFEKVQEKDQSGYISNTSEEDSSSVEDNNSPFEERKETSSPVSTSSSSKHSSMNSSKKSWTSGSATSHLSTSTTSTNADQRQIVVDSTVSIRKSLNFSNNSNNNGESMEIIRGSVDEMLLHRPLPVIPNRATITATTTTTTTESERITSVSLEVSQYKMLLIKFLREKVLCTQKNAYHYADMLIKNGVSNMDDLEMKLQNDESFLLNIGFDEEDDNEIKEYYVTRNNTKNNRQHKSLPQSSLGGAAASSSSPLRIKSVSSGLSLTRYDSNLSALSDNSSCCNSPVSPAVKSRLSLIQPGSSSLSSTDVAQLYYDASQCSIIIALEQLREIAADGHLLAQGYLMRMYAIGQGAIKKDINKAILLAETVFPYLAQVIALASSGKNVSFIDFLLSYPFSLFSLLSCVLGNSSDSSTLMYVRYLMGLCYSEGLVAKQDIKEAICWYRLSADSGYAAAQAYLGTCYYDGLGVTQNYNEAVKWYKLAAEQGFASAQCNLGLCYEMGYGIMKSNIEAVKWYRLGSNQGHGASRYNLAYCYEKGIGVERNLYEAIHLYLQSAEEGNYSPAQYILGSYYATGKYHVQKDLFKSFVYYKKAAENGHNVGAYKLAMIYEQGYGK
jgi:TPR repeat protein